MTTQSNGTATTKELSHAVGEKKPRSAALAVRDWMGQPTMSASLASALGRYMDVDTFTAHCYIAAQNPALAACSAESLFKAFLECAQMGLLPGAAHKHVAMVPRGGVITVSPQWQGLQFIMQQQEGIKRVRPVLVHRSDVFEMTETGGVRHQYDPFNDARVFEHPDTAKAAKREPGLRGGYLEITYDTGVIEYHFVSAAKIDRNRACAETQKLWLRWFEEMCLKTVVRDAFAKRVISINPELTARLARVDESENLALGNDPSRSMVALPSSRTETLARSLGAAIVEDTPNMANVEVIDATTDPS